MAAKSARSLMKIQNTTLDLAPIQEDERVELEHLRAQVSILQARVAVTEDLERQVASLWT